MCEQTAGHGATVIQPANEVLLHTMDLLTSRVCALPSGEEVIAHAVNGVLVLAVR